MKTSILVAGFIILVQALSAQVPVSPADELVLATYAYASNDRVANLQPLGDHLAAQLQQKVKVVSFPTVKALNQAIKAGEVDVALPNTFGYLMLQADSTPVIVPLVALKIPAGVSSNYRSAIVAHRSVAIDTIAALPRLARDHSFMFVAPGSTSGNLVPRLFLAGLGLAQPESDFREIVYGKTHANTILQVKEGKADFGACGSEEYDKLIAADPGARQAIRLLWRSAEIPLGPVVCLRTMPAGLQQRIKAILLALHQDNPAAFAALCQGWTEARHAQFYASVTDADYDPVRRTSGSLQDLLRIVNQFVQ
ncbi:MAG: putative phosphite transport system-binding protein PtxB [bacterium]|nr:putative phosphite transport system-binding protein PtxB [bacterium]